MAKGLAAAWVVVVASLTLVGHGGSGPRNLVPLRTIEDYLSDGQLPVGIRVRNLAGNLVLLAPLGLALAVATAWRVGRVVLGLVAVSASIEVWQLAAATGRSVDVDDVILNTVGGIAGWSVGLAVLGIRSRVTWAMRCYSGGAGP